LDAEICPYCGIKLEKDKHSPASTDDIAREYAFCVDATKNTSSSAIWKRLSNTFLSFKDYQDSEKYAQFCLEKYADASAAEAKESAYADAQNRISTAQTSSDWEAITALITQCGNHEDALSLLDSATNNLHSAYYHEAADALNAGQYAAAKDKFIKAGTYEDAPEQAAACDHLLKKRRNRKLSIILGSIAVLVIILASYIATTKYFIPKNHYTNASTAFSIGQYELAAEEYLLAGEYQDSPARAAEAVLAGYYAKGDSLFTSDNYVDAASQFLLANNYSDSADRIFECGTALIRDGNYAEASLIFSYLETQEATDYMYYAAAMKNLVEGNYADAIENFSYCSNVEDADERLKEANLLRGKELLDSNDYESALKYIEAADGYGDAEILSNACVLLEAEHYMSIGYLNSAKETYETLPEDFTYHDVAVSERLALLDEYSGFVAMCGKWRASGDQSCYSKQIWCSDTSYWDEWETTFTDPYDFLELTCIILDDGTVDIKGSAEYSIPTNYSSLSSLLRQSSKTSSISTNRSTIWPAEYVSINDNTSLWYEDGEWWLKYYKYDSSSSINFDYKYTSYWHYGTLVESY
jgi:tetratricopeptide (TPR) repeat protein